MPIGIIVNSISIVAGGIIGALVGGKLFADFKDKINMIFGCCSMAMGISSIVLMKNIPAVVFSIIIGTALGLIIHLGDKVNAGGKAMQRLLSGFIYPMTTETMVDDFKACGGFLMLATGFRMIKVKMFPTADMIPSMILVMPVSWLWTTYILPLVS